MSLTKYTCPITTRDFLPSFHVMSHKLSNTIKTYINTPNEAFLSWNYYPFFNNAILSVRCAFICSVFACSSTPCLNGGNCSEFQSGFGYTCSCPDGYVGTNCETQGIVWYSLVSLIHLAFLHILKLMLALVCALVIYSFPNKSAVTFFPGSI